MTKTMAKRFLHTGFAIIALLPFAEAGSRAETLDQLYEKAKLEKTVVFYSGGPAAPHENRAKEFMQKYPGITVSVTGGFSNVLNERIEKQMADQKLQVDMAFFQTVQDFVTWKKQGKLLAFKPEGFDQIMPNFRDEDGAYMALSANALTYAYNTSKVRAEDAPKSAQDFLKPMFAGSGALASRHGRDRPCRRAKIAAPFATTVRQLSEPWRGGSRTSAKNEQDVVATWVQWS